MIGYLTSSVDFIKVLSFLINLDLVGNIDKKISNFGDFWRYIAIKSHDYRTNKSRLIGDFSLNCSHR